LNSIITVILLVFFGQFKGTPIQYKIQLFFIGIQSVTLDSTAHWAN